MVTGTSVLAKSSFSFFPIFFIMAIFAGYPVCGQDFPKSLLACLSLCCSHVYL
jgi:hypothetical protein